MLIAFDDANLKKYINETYIYEIPSDLDFNKEIVSIEGEGIYNRYQGDMYAFVYNSIFDENIEAEKSKDISLFDPPLLDTTLVSYEKTSGDTYKVIGAYDGTGRIAVIVDYNSVCMVIKSIERYEEKSSIGKFKIEEVDEMPSGDFTELDITNPAYGNEPEENLTLYMFLIEGKYDVIGVSTLKTLDAEEETYDLGLGGENVVLKYKTMFPTDFSQDTLLIRAAGGNEYLLQLNDAVDRDPYLFEE
jgi:hypothetical protein